MSRPIDAARLAAGIHAFRRDRAGQGLVEIALALPFLLMMLLGTVDLGRAFYYSIGVSNAAGAAALAASRAPSDAVSRASVRQRVCDETGWVAYGDTGACSSLRAVTVACVANDPNVAVADPKVSVRVTFQWPLVSFYLAPIIGDPATTSVLVTYQLTNEEATPCTAP